MGNIIVFYQLHKYEMDKYEIDKYKNDKINELSEKSHNKISIMPGGGIRSNNIDEFLKNKYLREFHSSCIINNKFEESELKRLINRISYI